MPAIEYGIDGYGRKVSASEAVSGRTYRCFYCKENIHVRKGIKRVAYFAHSPIHDRTPQQMACEGYKGQGIVGGYIEDYKDKLYVYNGGVPLHLVETTEGKYELVAMFPPISDKNHNLLTDWDAKVRITGDGRDQIFSAWNLRRYKVKTFAKWIYAKPEKFKYEIEEVRRKWLWGIKGISLDDDLFRVDASGGTRVAQLGNIVVGKEYLFVHGPFGSVNNRSGLEFEKKGTLSISGGSYYRELNVYSVRVTKITDEAVAYIQGNGYNLIEEPDDLIPIWPPAVIEGKELIYEPDDNEGFFYHKKISNQEVYQWGSTSLSKTDEKNDVIKCSTDNNILLLSNYKFNSLAKEIRYILTYERENYKRDRIYNVSFNIEADSENIEDLNNLFNCNSSNIVIKSNYEKTQIINCKDIFVNKSSKKQAVDLFNSASIVLNYMPFGKEVVQKRIDEPKTVIEQLDYKRLLNQLYNCKSAGIMINAKLDKWIYQAKLENNLEMLRTFYVWKKLGLMPDKAQEILRQWEK